MPGYLLAISNNRLVTMPNLGTAPADVDPSHLSCQKPTWQRRPYPRSALSSILRVVIVTTLAPMNETPEIRLGIEKTGSISKKKLS